MNLLVLKGFNNYFNKKVKKYSTLSDYISNSSSHIELEAINFNPSDGVRTELVLGKGQLGTFFDFESTQDPDYLVCYTTVENVDTIESRWFIIEADRTRGGQYKLELRRDLLADYYNPIMSANCFVEKGSVTDVENAFLYHNENMTYNQIKKSETLLKDKTGCGWVVGYIPQDAFPGAKIISKDVPIESEADIEVADISQWSLYDYCSINSARVGATQSGSAAKIIGLKSRITYTSGQNVSIDDSYYWVTPPNDSYYKILMQYPQSGACTGTFDSSAIIPGVWAQQRIGQYWPTFYGAQDIANILKSYIQGDSTLWANANSYIEDNLPNGVRTVSASVISSIQATNGKTIKDNSTGLIYKIKVVNNGINGDVTLDTSDTRGAAILTRINADVQSSGHKDTKISGAHPDTVWANNYTANDVFCSYSGSVYSVVLTQLMTFAGVEIDSNRNHTVDAPYDIFCIPYSNTKRLKYGDNASDVCKCNKQLAVAIAQEVAADAGSGSIYDVQLLPYCPSQELLAKNISSAEDAIFDIRGISSDLIKDATDSWAELSIPNQSTFETYEALYGQIYDEDYREIYYYSASNSHYYRKNINGAAKVIGAMLWCSSCMLSFDINETITVSNDPVERKVANETEMYRLCSGNYNGVFEFSAAKSGGVNGFHVDCTFKPINPYIHVIPKLSGLYGNFASFGDVRGLICGGDFSLAQLSNAWSNYELNNKNYQNIFDRQIQNLDVNNGLALEQAKWQTGIGTFQGGMNGAMVGMIGTGSPWGALAGGVVGAGASLFGGLKDIDILKRSQAEARDYAIDQFGYQLGNIKAIPTSLSKNSSLNPNLKIFPFIEKYCCTDEEQAALVQKIRFNGMSIGAVSSLNNYNNDLGFDRCYLQGQLIDLDSITSDTHVANEIYNEVRRGFYILYNN